MPKIYLNSVGKKVKELFAMGFKGKTEEEKEEDEQIKKIQSAKTGVPITLSGYPIFDSNGRDTGKRFVRRKDAEEYLRKMNQEREK